MTDRALAEALAVSQRLGMLGERPIDEVIAHAGAFVDALAGTRGTVVDLGSGGGVPGLVIARAAPICASCSSIVAPLVPTTSADSSTVSARRIGSRWWRPTPRHSRA